uniref:Uncharacterized protein n=1 Tax=Brassica oleracea var. oleracea TaxID=109376 RepID=A0A0D3BSB0_BRAOL
LFLGKYGSIPLCSLHSYRNWQHLPCRLAVVTCILLEWFKKSSLLCKSESSFLKVKALSLIFFPAVLSWRMWEHTALDSELPTISHISVICHESKVPSKQLALQIQFPLFLCSFAVNSLMLFLLEYFILDESTRRYSHSWRNWQHLRSSSKDVYLVGILQEEVA